jgi:hypothetical protein
VPGRKKLFLVHLSVLKDADMHMSSYRRRSP